MAFRSSPAIPRKLERAAVLMLALSDLLVAGGERVGVLGHDERAVTGKTVTGRVLQALASSGMDEAGLELPGARIPAHARAVLFGDFLCPPMQVRSWLEPQTTAGVQGVLVQVIDPAEETFPYSGRMRVEGSENDDRLVVENAATLAVRYRAVWQAHRASISQEASRRGWLHLIHRTDQPATTALVALWQALGASHAGRA